MEERNSNFVKWDLYFLEKGKKPKKVLDKKEGKFRFQQFAAGSKFLIVAYTYEPELDNASVLLIEVVTNKKPDILNIKLTDGTGSPISKPLSYGQKVNVHVNTSGMIGHKVTISLWKSENGLPSFAPELEKTVTVGSKGVAYQQFVIPLNTLKMIDGLMGKSGAKDEFYVTAFAHGERVNSADIKIKSVNTLPSKQEHRHEETKDYLKGKPTKKTTPIPPVKKKIVLQQGPQKSSGTVKAVGLHDVYITDDKGAAIRGTYKGQKIRVWIISHGLIGKVFKFKLLEDDGGAWVDDELKNKNYNITSDKTYVDVTLNTIPKSLGDDYFEHDEQELFVDIEILETKNHLKSATIDVDAKVFKQDPAEASNTVSKVGAGDKKEKFDKVKDKGEEAIIHISSEIATAIEVDKNGKLISYPDNGAYNGLNEYVENENIYCKKISSTKSAFPTFKAYIYRGNAKGEAIKKLRQDIKFKTHENAESTVLEVARHSSVNNKNYKYEGPIPPNSVDKLYGLRYKMGTNNSNKTSYRYRMVDSMSTNCPLINDVKKEYSSGSMNLGGRSSISIDPWKSSGLIGCIGIRGSKGENHPSTKDTFSKQDVKNYKFIYHSINNYLEGLIPELTGVYGRRGFSSDGSVDVLASTYDHETNVYVLVDLLPEISDCTCVELKPPVRERKLFYESFGTKCIDYIDKKSSKNKFKGLYMVAQRRQENGFSIKTIGNNPMNIKGKGDLGQVAIDTHETINGKYISVPGEKFANFSTEDSGFQGYLNLLDSNYSDAYKSLFDDNKTIDDFTAGLEDTGAMGPYATGRANGSLSGTDVYKAAVKSILNSVKNDYLKVYECKLCKEKDVEKKKKIKVDITLLKKLK